MIHSIRAMRVKRVFFIQVTALAICLSLSCNSFKTVESADGILTSWSDFSFDGVKVSASGQVISY
jgi:hypothetical protein